MHQHLRHAHAMARLCAALRTQWLDYEPCVQSSATTMQAHDKEKQHDEHKKAKYGSLLSPKLLLVC